MLVKTGLTDKELKRTTVAVGRVLDGGELVDKVVINGTAPQSAVEKIRAAAPEAIQAPGVSHAETYLYSLFGGDANVQAIGVSHWKGPCPELCRPFFNDQGFSNVWWFGFVR